MKGSIDRFFCVLLLLLYYNEQSGFDLMKSSFFRMKFIELENENF